MKRRSFLRAGISGAAAICSLQSRVYASPNETPLRIGLIGCGWYGKTDLLHLIQVAPTEVVGLCDVDTKMSDEAAELVSARQRSGRRPPTFSDYRRFREFSNGQTGDLCIHFFNLVRYFLELEWPRSISASGGILMRDAGSPVNTHDTQTAMFDYGDVQVVWNQRN